MFSFHLMETVLLNKLQLLFGLFIVKMCHKVIWLLNSSDCLKPESSSKIKARNLIWGFSKQKVVFWEEQNRTMASGECFLLDLETDNFILYNFSVNQSANFSLLADEWFYPAFLYAIPTIYGIIILIGLIGNITLIKIFCTVKSMRNVPNLFISSLALGDLLLLVTCVPVDASRYLADEWLFGRTGCKLIPLIQLTSVGVSVFTLTALSADR